MAALDDAERVLPQWTGPPAVEPAMQDNSRHLLTRQLLSVAVAIGGMQLMAAMDGPVAVFALPKIQNELGLSDAGRSWVITAYVLTFGGLILLGGRLGDAIGLKRAFIIGVALFTFVSAVCWVAWAGSVLVL